VTNPLTYYRVNEKTLILYVYRWRESFKRKLGTRMDIETAWAVTVHRAPA